MAKIVLLNSGGLDSALVSAYAKLTLGHEVHSLFVDTKQLNRTPTMAAAATTASKWCSSHYVAELDFGICTNYWETIGEPTVEMYDALTPAQNAVYKANRPFQDFHVMPNLAMVGTSIGVAYAKCIGATEVYSGHRLVLSEGYISAYNEMANTSLHRLGRPQLVAPFHDSISYVDALTALFGHVPSAAEIAYAQNEFRHTYSCRWETPCGVCEKCTGRAELGLT